uniref:C-type lectin domain-containing protein n=1 Tax=Mastacembelus armatus TaxID=205130 RepID=A0A3Q3RGR9_9TELE
MQHLLCPAIWLNFVCISLLFFFAYANSYHSKTSFPFYCINISVVNMKMAWEEALEHCRKNKSDLPSLLSETELLQAQNAVQKAHISDPVWIGLRYLSDHWLWVKGDPLVYENWPQGDQDHQCPVQKRCGALTTNKGWENRDCQDKLRIWRQQLPVDTKCS